MSPFKATCKDCGSELRGEQSEDIGDMMIAHHRQGRLDGSWTSGACGIFFVQEIDSEGKVVEGGKNQWLETTMNVVCRPWTGEILYDPRRKESR